MLDVISFKIFQKSGQIITGSIHQKINSKSSFTINNNFSQNLVDHHGDLKKMEALTFHRATNTIKNNFDETLG